MKSISARLNAVFVGIVTLILLISGGINYFTAKADLEGVKTDTQCLLAHVSLVCSETAAMSRISQ